MIPTGPSTHINAEVVSRTSRSGPTGNTGLLITIVENGDRISVEVPPTAAIRTGDKVVLSTHDRYLIGPKYSFAGKLINAD